MMTNKSREALAFRDYLNDEEETELIELINICNDHDKTGYGFPEDADCYGLLYLGDRLCSALAVFGMGAGSNGRAVDEISAWTHPDFRENGLFGRLYSALFDEYEMAEVNRFAIYSNAPALAVLDRLGAWHTYDECIMRLRLGTEADIYRDRDGSELSIASELTVEDGVCECRYGSCSYKLYGATAYIYGVLIYDSYRSKGYGLKLMYSVLELLRELSVAECFLEVSSLNAPALGLYSKLGFRIEERLSYYERVCNLEGTN